jgi:hypothetical protein
MPLLTQFCQEGKITKDQALQLAQQMRAANLSADKSYTAYVFERLKTLPSTKRDTPVTQHVSASKGLDPELLSKLDDGQRMAVMISVKEGKLSVDEAMKLVSEFVNPTVALSPVTSQPSEEDREQLFAAFDRMSSGRLDEQRSSSVVLSPSISPVAPPRAKKKAAEAD